MNFAAGEWRYVAIDEVLRVASAEDTVRLMADAGWTVTQSGEGARILDITGDTMSIGPAPDVAEIVPPWPSTTTRNRGERRTQARRRKHR